jgi:hypothetical protein
MDDVDRLVSMLLTGDDVARDAALRGLRDLCGGQARAPDIVDVLLRRPATSKEALLRLATVLRHCLERRDPAATDRCLALLASGDLAARDACLRLLGVNATAWYLPHTRLLPVVLQLAGNEDPRCRSRCFHLLKIVTRSHMPPHVRVALDALENDADPGVRKHARTWGRRYWTICPCEL